jgi:hypothetical protein
MVRKSKVEATGTVIRAAIKERSVKFQGDQVIDWDKIYEDMLDQGMSPMEAATALDKYMEDHGHM